MAWLVNGQPAEYEIEYNGQRVILVDSNPRYGCACRSQKVTFARVIPIRARYDGLPRYQSYGVCDSCRSVIESASAGSYAPIMWDIDKWDELIAEARRLDIIRGVHSS